MTDLNPEGLERAAEALTPIADVDGMGPTFDQLRPVDQEWVTNMARAAVTAYLGHAANAHATQSERPHPTHE